MDLRQTAVTAALLLGLAGAASAQSAFARTGAPEPSRSVETPAVDLAQLPIDVRRIERQLRRSAEREESDGLNLRYYVDVYGQAPRIRLFAPESNLRHGPVPYGAPTHAEMLNQMTPKEYRAPAANFLPLFRWLADRGGKDN